MSTLQMPDRFVSAILAVLLGALLVAPLSSADEQSDKQRQLKTLLQKIDKLKQAIDVKEDSKSQYIKQLKSIERSIGRVNQKIGTINASSPAKMSSLPSRFMRHSHWDARKRSSCYSRNKNLMPCNATWCTTSIFPMPAST